MTQLMSAMCVLGMILLALLIVTNAISLGQAAKAFGKAFVLLVVVLWALCVLKGLAAVAVSALKNLAVWVAVLAFGRIGLAVLVRIISTVWMRLQRDSVKQEEDYE